MHYSIDGRPTQELFFTTDEGPTFCIGENGEITATPAEDLSILRFAPMDEADVNADVRAAVRMAKAYAAEQGWTLTDEFFFD
jgi:hypothetical protein